MAERRIQGEKLFLAVFVMAQRWLRTSRKLAEGVVSWFRRPLRHAHLKLRYWSRHYDAWHQYPHHEKVHWGAASIALAVAIAQVLSVFVVPVESAFAASKNWDFSQISEYTFDNSKIGISNGVAFLKGVYIPGTTWIATDASGEDWRQRKAVTIDNSANASVLTNYQLALDDSTGSLNLGIYAAAQSDGKDIRFTSSDAHTELSYWVESYNQGTQRAQLWVKVPTIAASTTTTIYLYYNNITSGLTNHSSQAQTFVRVNTSLSFGSDYQTSTTPNYVAGDGTPTYTRATSGTYLDKASGLLQTAASGTPRYEGAVSTMTQTAAGTTNLIKNSEQLNASGWNPTAGVSVFPNTSDVPDPNNGNTAEKIVYDGSGTAGNYRLFTSFALPAVTINGQAYTVSIYLRTSAGSVNVRLYGNLGSYSSFTVTSTWARYSFSFTGNGTAGAQLLIYSPAADNSSFTLYGWGAQGETGATATTYVPTTSTIARREATYSTTMAKSAGVEIEPAATNLWSYSDQLDNAVWGTFTGLQAFGTDDGLHSVANKAIAPDGTLAGEKLTETTSSGGHYMQQNVTLNDSTVYTVSWYVKAAERTGAGIEFKRKDGTWAVARWDLSSATIASTQGGVVKYGITPVGNGWYRVWLSANSLTGASTPYVVYEITVGSNYAYQGDGVSGIYAWGAQIEAGTGPTSYIPTASIAQSRNADSLTYPTASNIDYHGGVISMWVRTPWAGGNDGTEYDLFSVGETATKNRVAIYKTTTGTFHFIVYGSTDSGYKEVQVAATSTVWSANQWHHVALSYLADGTVTVWLDGSIINSNASGGSFTPITQLGSTVSLGMSSTGGNQVSGQIKNVRIFGASAVSDAANIVSAEYSQGSYVSANTSGNELMRVSTGSDPTISSGGIGAPADFYRTDSPTISPTAGQRYSTILGLSETDASGSSGSITYQISPDNGTTWYWWNGASWAATVAGATESNPAATITSHAASFTVGDPNKTLLWRSYLQSDGSQQPRLDTVTLNYLWDSEGPPNPTVTAKNGLGGATTLVSGEWGRYATPSFSWNAPTDTADVAGGEEASGIDGYYVYWGNSATADPYGAGTYQTGTTYTVATSMTSGATYYLRFVTKDKAGNKSNPATLFTYKYDGIAPTNPTFVSVSPAGYTGHNSYTFLWPSSGTGMAQDPGAPTAGSGLAGYQYKTGATLGSLADWSNTTTDNQVNLEQAAYQEGANVFSLRAIDTAGNASDPITVTFYYAGNAPSAPRNLTVTPSTGADSPSATNSFAFTWQEPETFNGSIKQYRYSINALPTATNTQIVAVPNLTAGPYATQQGKNTLYVVAEDEAGNVNYDAPASIHFYAGTAAPGIPESVTVLDSSNRDRQEYSVLVKWSVPASTGTGFAGYEVYRSSDGGATFASIGTTSGTSYVDEHLQSKPYAYYLKAKDNANQYSAASSIVSLTPTGRYTTPPALQDGPSVAARAFSATVTWLTDRVASSFVEYGTDSSHLGNAKGGKTAGQLDSIQKHQVPLDGLQPSTIYYYQTAWVDSDGNQGRSDVKSFQTAPRPNIADVAISNVTLTSATISWTTTTVATSSLAYGPTTAYGQVLEDHSGGQTTQHSVNLTNLTPSTTYHLQISGTDSDSQGLLSDDYTFTTLTQPVVSNFRFESVAGAPTSTVKLTWTTNVPATSVVQVTDLSGATTRSEAQADLLTDHSITVANLADQSSYRFQAKSVDAHGNEALSEVTTMTTPDDTRPPKINNLQVEIRSNGSGTGQKAQLVVSWETDEPATSQVEYGPGIASSDYPQKSQEDKVLTTTHVVIVSELDPAKLYHLRAVSHDKAGNQGNSPDTTAITGKLQQSVVDVILNSLQQSFGFLGNLSWLHF